MKNKLLLMRFTMVLAVLVLINSCSTFTMRGYQYQLNTTSENIQVIGDYKIKVSVTKFLGQSGVSTFANISSEEPDYVIKRAIQKEIAKRGGTGAVNIKIKYGSNPLHWILNAITFNIVAPAKATVTFTVIKEIKEEGVNHEK